MFDSKHYTDRIRGEICKVDFESFIPTATNPEPDVRVYNFMVAGPFVLQTHGAFETEYLYERNLTLDEDYLSEEGGEASVAPYIGLAHHNNYLGDKTVVWRHGRNKWGVLRFDKEEDSACDDALFLTEQRNCAFYAAVYVDCKTAYDAVICYETSGALMYLNGELVSNEPYGRVKGLWNNGNSFPVHFQKGRNLILMKVRSGYICDTMDITVSLLTVFPVLARSGNAAVCMPYPVNTFFGTVDKPEQVFPVIVCALDADTKATVSITCGDKVSNESIELTGGCAGLVRLTVPAKKTATKQEVTLAVEAQGSKAAKTQLTLSCNAFDGFDGTEHIMSDFHFDTTYHQEQRTYALGAVDILAKMIKKLDSNPDFKATLSEVDYLHPYYSLFPDDREKLKNAFASGRAEADCFYNQPNEMTSSAEGLVRNLVYGQLYHRDVMGRKAYVYGPGDVFGHPNQLSQICRKGDCSAIAWGKHIFGLDSLFHGMSPDGSTLLHSRGGTSRAMAASIGTKHSHDSTGSRFFTGYPRDDDTSWMKNTVSHAKYAVFSDLSGGVLEDDKKAIRETGKSLLQTTSRDISLYHAGVSLTRTDLKQANRLGENLLITAEKLAAIASLYGARYPDEALDEAWRQILCGQHHDSITGTNNEISFVDLMIEYREAAELAAGIINDALCFIYSGVKLTCKDYPVFVFNPQTVKRKDACTIVLPAKSGKSYSLVSPDSKRYPLTPVSPVKDGKCKFTFIPELPALGYCVFYLAEDEAVKAPVTDNGDTVENEFFRLRVNAERGGSIVSLYDKKAGREIMKTGSDTGSFVAALKEVHDRMETQHEFYTTGEKLFSYDYPAEIERFCSSELERITVRSLMGTLSGLVQQFTLYRGVRRVEVKITVEDYMSEDSLYTFNLPVSIEDSKAIFDDRFAPAVRPKSRHTLDFRTHQYAMFSHCSVFAANQWFCAGPSVRMSFDNNGSVNIGPTALICAEDDLLNKAALQLTRILSKKAIPVTPYPDKARVSRATLLPHFNDDLHFTDTRFVLSLEGIPNEYENKLLAQNSSVKDAFEKQLNKNGFAVLYSRDSDNLWAKPIDVVLIKAKNEGALLSYIDGIENSLKTASTFDLTGTVCTQAPQTADDYTVGILNRGTLASSVEGDGSLNMMLFHTASFYGNSGKVTGGKELIPEQKTHVFEFAVYAGKGTYRECGLYKEAMLFNDSPLCSIGKQSSGKKLLPEKESFAECADNFIITSLKAGGYPLASLKGKFPSITERGITVRGFEQNGEEASLKMSFPFGINTVYSSNLLEEDIKPVKHSAKGFKYDVLPHSIETFLLFPGEQPQIGKSTLGAVTQPVGPVYIRSWEHSRGTMPFMYLGTCAVIGRKLEHISDTRFSVDISVVNNYTDKEITGTLKLNLPKGISTKKKSFSYKLKPGCSKVFPTEFIKATADTTGVIYLSFEDSGNELYDALSVGFFDPSLTMRLDDKDIVVTVRNDTDQYLPGELSLATPFETWGMGFAGTESLSGINPLSYSVELKAGESAEYRFNYTDCGYNVFNAFWACAKLMVNGKIYYSYIKRDGERHNLWAHEFISKIESKGNSLEEYLKLN